MLKTADACCILVKNPVYWRHLVLKKILSPISLMFCFFQVSMTLFLMAYDCFVRAFSYIHIYITLFGGSCLYLGGFLWIRWRIYWLCWESICIYGGIALEAYERRTLDLFVNRLWKSGEQKNRKDSLRRRYFILWLSFREQKKRRKASRKNEEAQRKTT